MRPRPISMATLAATVRAAKGSGLVVGIVATFPIAPPDMLRERCVVPRNMPGTHEPEREPMRIVRGFPAQRDRGGGRSSPQTRAGSKHDGSPPSPRTSAAASGSSRDRARARSHRARAFSGSARSAARRPSRRAPSPRNPCACTRWCSDDHVPPWCSKTARSRATAALSVASGPSQAPGGKMSRPLCWLFPLLAAHASRRRCSVARSTHCRTAGGSG